MTLQELKAQAFKSKSYRELLKKINGKKYVSSEALISEEAEKLKKDYLYIFQKLHNKEYGQYCFYIQKCILPSYKEFNEVVDLIRELKELNPKAKTLNDLYLLAYNNKKFIGVKYSTFEEAYGFLNLENS